MSEIRVRIQEKGKLVGDTLRLGGSGVESAEARKIAEDGLDTNERELGEVRETLEEGFRKTWRRNESTQVPISHELHNMSVLSKPGILNVVLGKKF